MGLEKEHQEIVLPESGEKITVRHLRTLDYTFVGAMPDTLLATFLKMTGKKDVSVQDLDPDSAEFMVSACIRGIVKQPEKFALVSKHPKDCTDDEFSFYDLKNGDQAELMNSIFSGGEGLPLDFLKALRRKMGEGQPGANEKQAAG